MLTHVGSFLAHARSIFQYAQKEAKEAGLQSKYDSYVSNNDIIRFFKEIRDSEIHEYGIGSLMTITGHSPIDEYGSTTKIAIGKEFKINVEDLSDLESPRKSDKGAEIQITLLRRIEVTKSLIKDFILKGETDLVDAANDGKELYEELDCNGEKDLFKLCDNYINEIEQFIKFGTAKGFIS